MARNKKWVALLVLGMLVVAGGCQSKKTPADTIGLGTSPEPKVIYAGKGNAPGVIYVVRGDKVSMLTTEGSTMCSSCQLDALNYAKTDRITARCGVCGAIRTPYHEQP